MKKTVFIAAIIAILIAPVAFAVVMIRLIPQPDERGQFGDMFGALNCLFSACAFLGLIYTIYHQRHELQLQREELKLSRSELEASVKAQTDAATSLAAQLRESETQRQLDAALAQFEYLNSPEAMKARRVIFSLSSVQELDPSKPECEGTLRFLNHLNHIAYLIAKGFVPPTELMEMFYITAIRVWVTLEEWILEQRRVKGVYLSHFQWLVEESVQFWKERHPEASMNVVNAATGKAVTIHRDALEKHLAEIRPLRYHVK